MGMSFGLALCIVYLSGLLLSAIAGNWQLGVLMVPWSGLAGGIAVGLWGLSAPRHLRLGWPPRYWGSLAVMFLLATIHITMRSPSAGAPDISNWVEQAEAIGGQQVIVGRLVDDPRLNRDLKGRFFVSVQQLQVLDTQGELTFQMPVRGRVYVTAPLLQVTGLHQGQLMKAKGQLYRPSPAMNPNGFDFQAYLAQRGTFTGFVAAELRFREAGPWGLWRVRQRIVQTQVRALGSPLGQLVSAMALGRNAVDLPPHIQDVFTRVGLAHTIAASGFHVSLLLGTVLALLRSRLGTTKFVVGSAVLLGYVTLTGMQASVIRAAIMGGATLIGVAMNRRVMPSGALLLAATLMLLVNPHWIWNIGFQLSVMATWGLIVTVPAIVRRLDWLPVTWASLVAVPIAATVWTLPLTLYHFNVFAGLSVVLNVVAMPFVTVISLGGITSSALALVSPLVGGAIASLLYWPTKVLLWLAETSSHLPGSSIAIGQITLWQLAGLYAVLFCGLMLTRDRRLWLKPLLAIVFLALLGLPLGWRSLTQHQVTVLAAGGDLVWVQQQHGRTTLVNSGDRKTAFYTVEPFLTQAGVNHIDRAIALPFNPNYQDGWQSLLSDISSKHLYGVDETLAAIPSGGEFHRLPVGESWALAGLTMQLLGTENPIVRLGNDQQSWLLLPQLSLPLQDYLAKAGSVLQSQVLVWSGDEISLDLLQAVNPQVAIGYGDRLSESVERELLQSGIRVFWTQRDGAITWRSHQGFHGYLETKHRNALLGG